MKNEEAIQVLKATITHNVGAKIEDIRDAIDLAISALERDRWISAEKPPERSGAYLVYLQAPLDFGDDRNDWGYVTEMYFDKGQTMWQDDNESYNAILDAVDKESEYFVSHYRKLPEPPKEDKPE